jgi:hypothetical protein
VRRRLSNLLARKTPPIFHVFDLLWLNDKDLRKLPLRKRQAQVSEEIKEISWKAQQRLHERYRKLLAKGKNKGVVMTAVGRELLGFIWAIGIKAETAQKGPLQRAA